MKILKRAVFAVTATFCLGTALVLLIIALAAPGADWLQRTIAIGMYFFYAGIAAGVLGNEDAWVAEGSRVRQAVPS
jgi:hypothetical protein